MDSELRKVLLGASVDILKGCRLVIPADGWSVTSQTDSGSIALTSGRDEYS